MTNNIPSLSLPDEFVSLPNNEMSVHNILDLLPTSKFYKRIHTLDEAIFTAMDASSELSAAKDNVAKITESFTNITVEKNDGTKYTLLEVKFEDESDRFSLVCRRNDNIELIETLSPDEFVW